MPTLSDLATSYTRKPTATVRLGGRRWDGVLSLSRSQAFGGGISGGSVVGRAPPFVPIIGMTIAWTWGYNGVEVPGFTGIVTDVLDSSYPDRWKLECKDILHRADQVQQVIATDPLNNITARAAVEYILTHYGGIPASQISIPNLEASGTAWSGSHWTLGTLTPVAWGDTETNSGGTTALKACQEICSVLGYWLYCDASGIVRAKQMERRPSPSALRTFQRGVDLLVSGAPERQASYDAIRNRVVVRGANTGVEGAQIMDAFQTNHPQLPAGVYREFQFSSFLIEYVNASEAGAASATSVARRMLGVQSRVPDVLRGRVKADPRIQVGATLGVRDSGVRLTTAKNYFVYSCETSLDLQAGKFDQQLILDGGTGSQGYTTIPAPDAAFTWRLMVEGLDGDTVVEVFLDGSGATSLTEGEIISWSWSTSATPYGGTPDTASGVTAMLLFPLSAGSVDITLAVEDTTSKIGTTTQTIDLTGADGGARTERTLSVAFGSGWAVSADGGQTWTTETTNGDAIAVPPYGAGIDSRAAEDSATTYGLLATRGSGGAGGLRQTLDELATASTNLAAASGAVRCIWVNEANPARVWWAVGDTVYRSTDGGATGTAMAKPHAGTNVNWIIEDPAVDDSVFVACGANLYNATVPTLGWATLYAGPTGATARCFVRSRDGQVTWVAYTGTFSGSPLQRVENGVGVTFPGATSEIRALALNKDASSQLATIYAIDSEDPAGLFAADGLAGGAATAYGSAFPAGATVQHMLADPDVDLLYVADFDSITSGTGALRKFFPSADALFLAKAGDTGAQAHMVGLGGTVPGAVELLLIPANASGAADALFHYTPGRGWQSITPPQASWYWVQIVADPTNIRRWLLLGVPGPGNTITDSGGVLVAGTSGDSPLYLTEDAGATWQPIDLPSFDGTAPHGITDMVFAEDGAAWVVGGAVNAFNPDIARSTVVVWRGTGTTVSSSWNDQTRVETAGVTVGPAGGTDVVLQSTFQATNNAGLTHQGQLGYTATNSLTTVGSAILDNVTLDRLPRTSKAVVGVSISFPASAAGSDEGSVWASSDYTASGLTKRVSGNQGGSATAAADAVYIGRRVGLLRITDILTSPVVTTVGAPDQTFGVVRADRQTRTAVAARVDSGTTIYVYDGASWSTVETPAAADISQLADALEIMRSTD